MKCLHIFRILHSTSGISCYRAIHTNGAMLSRRRTRNTPRAINYEPGLRHTEDALSENLNLLEIQNEEDLEKSAEFMNFEEEYEMIEEERRQKKRLGYTITAKKFFKSPPLPLTLSCNERECIRYLHKTDPLQWNIKVLSESFPATPDAIRKVLKGKFKFSEEEKRRLDLKVQENWQLLSEGKLQAPPKVLEHLKKFINRREVLLEQIKKADFYLPEVKEEVTWNNGEMSSILVHYEKAIEKLSCKWEPQEILSSGSQESSRKVKKQMNVCANSEKSGKLKDVKEEHNSLEGRSELAFPNVFKKVFCEVSAGTESEGSSSVMKKSEGKSGIEKLKCNLPDSRSEYAFSKEFKKIFCDVSAETEAEDSSSAMMIPYESDKSEEKSGIKRSGNKKDFSDPERLRLENQYYSKQVKDIEDTAFWNKNRTSQEKAMAESGKMALGGPDIPARGNICSSEVYPERIKIPRDKRGSGLTFRVKDCYYDDDGEFLYRVPGMVK